MGQVRIEIAGSFKDGGTVVFSATEGGHAYALSRAINFLVGKLPNAIRQDHANAAAGSYPPASAFGTLPQHHADPERQADDGG